MRRCGISGAALGFLLLVGCFSSALAGGLYLNEFATPSMGTAGAGQEAYVADASTNFAFHNPAGVTRLEGDQISLGAGLLVGETRFDADQNTAFSGGNQASFAPLLGSHGVLDLTEDLKLGMSVFSVAGASLDPDNSWVGRFQLQEISLLTITANPSVAYRVSDWFSLGVGFQAMYASIDYELAAPPVPPPNGSDGQIEVDSTDWAYGYNFGALFEISERTRVGITYISKKLSRTSRETWTSTRETARTLRLIRTSKSRSRKPSGLGLIMT